jgi:hypothetical protein
MSSPSSLDLTTSPLSSSLPKSASSPHLSSGPRNRQAKLPPPKPKSALLEHPVLKHASSWALLEGPEGHKSEYTDDQSNPEETVDPLLQQGDPLYTEEEGGVPILNRIKCFHQLIVHFDST